MTMKLKAYFIAMACCAVLASCGKDDDGEGGGGTGTGTQVEDMTFTATIESVTDGPTIAWAADDAISVLDEAGNHKFTTTGSGATATFSGRADANAESFVALYPFQSGISLNGGKGSVSVSAEQTAVAGGFSGTNYAVAYAANDDAKTLNFKNVPAYLKITLSAADKVSSVTVAAKNGEQLAGEVDVTVADEITITEGSKASSTVTLVGDALDGTFYIQVLPQTLSGGYTLTMLNDEDLSYTQEVTSSVALSNSQAYDLGSFSGMEWVEAVNPNPTTVPSFNLIKASFEEADFNVVSEPGFEDYAAQALGYRSSWRFDAGALSTTAHAGDVAVTLANPTPGVFLDMAVQTVALRQNTDYVYSMWGQSSTANVYTGLRTYTQDGSGNALLEIKGPDWAPQTEWSNQTLQFTTNPGTFYADVFCLIWGDEGAYFTADDISLIPRGYDKKSMDATTASVLGTVSNTTFSTISDLGKAVMWKGLDGKLRIALSDVTVKGTHYDNAIAITDAEDVNGPISITSFVKEGAALTPILTPGEGEISIVPNSVFTLNGKTYMHYFAKSADQDANKWTASSAGFLVSEDDGLTWTKGTATWSGDGGFVQASVCEKDGTLYMVGSKAGRGGTGDYWLNIYVAKTSSSSDLTDPTAWEYFNGTEWIAGDENVCKEPTCCLAVGCTSEPAIVYNAKFDRFMMIYRSNVHGGLVFRDADAVDGFWSGEKIITDDDVIGGMSYAPSVLEVSADGELVMAAPQL